MLQGIPQQNRNLNSGGPTIDNQQRLIEQKQQQQESLSLLDIVRGDLQRRGKVIAILMGLTVSSSLTAKYRFPNHRLWRVGQ